MYQDIIPENGVEYLGWFQNENYFKQYKEEIIEMFTPKLNNIMEKYPKLNNSYFLHVRRGDYVGNSNYDFPMEHYRSECFSQLSKDHIYVFSDDPEWCKQNIKYENMTIVQEPNELNTLYLMSRCWKGGICANSSLSWWGSYLNNNPNKKVFMPSKWYKDFEPSTIYPSYAIIVDIYPIKKTNDIEKKYIVTNDKQYIEACDDAINKGYNMILIMYDNLILQNNWEKITQECIEKLNQQGDWDMFMINCMGYISWSEKGLRKAEGMYLNGAHVLTRNVIGKSVEEIQKRGKSWFYFPFLAIQKNNDYVYNWTMEMFYPNFKDLFTQREKFKIVICGDAHNKNMSGFIKGCEKFGLSYKIVKTFNETENIDYEFIWLPKDYISPELLKGKKVMYGPHFFVFPTSSLEGKYDKYHFYDCLSNWNLKIHENFDLRIPLITLPFGVDTYKFTPGEKKDEIFIYMKNRHPLLYEQIKYYLSDKYKVNLIIYGSYKEDDYIKILQKSLFGIWIGSHESQGFALQEALSCDVPLLIFNVKSMKDEYVKDRYTFDNISDKKLEATSVPYWSEKCGEIFYEISEFTEKLSILEKKLGTYHPREFVLQNLSVEKCMERLLNKYEISFSPPLSIKYITYADNNYKTEMETNLAQINISKIGYTRNDIDSEFMEKNKRIFSERKGGGYWLWKPYFILKALRENDVVVYCDAGSRLQNINQLLQNEYTIFEVDEKEIKYTKRDLIKYLNAENFINSAPICATAMILRKQHIPLVEKWLEIASDYHLLTDEKSILEEYPEFKEHKHDQSIFSLLCKINGLKPLSSFNKYIDQRYYILNLEQLGTKYGTDKVSHGFCKVYDTLFQYERQKVQKMAEIGVFFGASMEMWKDYFPTAIIYGLDSFKGIQGNGGSFDGYLEYYNKRKENPHDRIKLEKVDQHIRDDLDKFASVNNNFDIILDDGSHLMYDQQITFGILFKCLKPGGCFIIEDLHTSLQKGYDVDGSNSTLDILKRYQKEGKWHSKYLTEEELDYLNQNTRSCEIYIVNENSITSCIRKTI